ncbi:MAG: glutamate 5-kinase [bacterium]|nr:glutamate 5-kinase [bacterium]
MRKKIVLKIGTATLTAGSDRISRGKIEDMARQIIQLKDEYQIILVSSGAIATAKQFINISGWENVVASKQAMSAIGQPKLMQIYSEVFNDFGIKIAQCLMTYRDFENEEAQVNTINTIEELLKHDYVPIINENDTVATEELVVGDNDKLGALVTTLMNADMLVLASDIDGVFDKNPHTHSDARLIEQISDLQTVKHFIEERDNGLGTGGMTSKFEAAEVCLSKNIEMRITNGANPNFLVNCLTEKTPHTKFLPGVLTK